MSFTSTCQAIQVSVNCHVGICNCTLSVYCQYQTIIFKCLYWFSMQTSSGPVNFWKINC